MSEKIKPVVKMLKLEANLLVESLLIDDDLMRLDCAIYNHIEKLKKIYDLLRTYNVSLQLADVASDLGMDEQIIEELKNAGLPIDEEFK